MSDLNQFLNYQAPADLLAGRTLVVTGAGDGIGRAVSLALAGHGATVVLLGRTEEKLEQVYDAIEAAGGPEPAIYTLDLATATEADYRQLADVLATEFGVLDGLLHNASQLGARTPLQSYPVNDWQTVLQVNLTAPFLLTRALLPTLLKAKDARILFTGSTVGVKGRAFWGAYAVSKGATETLMQVLADELEETHVRVNSINPGATRTAMRAAAYPAEDPTKVTAPDEIVNRYLFLLGPDSRGCHGLQLDAQPK